MLVVFAAGGTGGHIYPAISIANELKAVAGTKASVLFVGTGTELETRLIGAAGYEHVAVTARPVVGKGAAGFLRFLSSLPAAYSQLKTLYRNRQPAVVIGFGGYPSFLPVLVARFSGLPTAIQEQNIRSGTANCVLGLFVKKIFAASGSGPWVCEKKVERVANPVRSEFYKIPNWTAPRPVEQLRLLVVGGSQGAMSLNSAVLELVSVFKELNIEVTHQSGDKDFERVKTGYDRSGFLQAKVSPFISDMASAYAAAHLVVCRAGATTVAELSAAGRPAIFVPLAIAKGHQAENVKEALKAGAAFSLPQDARLASGLTATLRTLLAEPRQLGEMAARFRKLSLSANITPAQFIAQRVLELAERAG